MKETDGGLNPGCYSKASRMLLVECRCSIMDPDVDSLCYNWVLGKRKKNNNKGGLSEVPWLTVGLVVGHQSIRTRVLVISRLVLLTPGLLVPELQTHQMKCYL